MVGTIVRTNLDAAPKCAVHRIGKGEPPDCRSPLPAFAIGDEKGETRDAIEVMGWAANFAQLYSLIEAIDRAPADERVKRLDEFWGTELPNPVPAVGAKVRVTGRYGVTFTKSSG